MDTVVIRTEGLGKTFRRKRGEQFTALSGLSLEIRKGEVFGFLGPNGAGKTTTIKILMNLIFATSGSAWILDKPCADPRARRHIGYLPEISNLFDFLTFEEVLDFAGRCQGMSRKETRAKTDELADVLDMVRAKKVRLRKFSKGMLQRVGLAYALMGDPEVLILDEPMSGLDPIGRKDLVELIRRLKDQGKTVFFSSHILSDIGTVCDRMGILVRGRMRKVGRIADVLHEDAAGFLIRLRGIGESDGHRFEEQGSMIKREGGDLIIESTGAAAANVLAQARSLKGEIVSIDTKRKTLEDVFLDVVKSTADQ